MGEALDDADFGFTWRLSREVPADQRSQLTSALFGDDSLPEEGEELRGEPDDEITESTVIPGTPQAKRVRNVCVCVCVCVRVQLPEVTMLPCLSTVVQGVPVVGGWHDAPWLGQASPHLSAPPGAGTRLRPRRRGLPVASYRRPCA